MDLGIHCWKHITPHYIPPYSNFISSQYFIVSVFIFVGLACGCELGFFGRRSSCTPDYPLLMREALTSQQEGIGEGPAR